MDLFSLGRIWRILRVLPALSCGLRVVNCKVRACLYQAILAFSSASESACSNQTVQNHQLSSKAGLFRALLSLLYLALYKFHRGIKERRMDVSVSEKNKANLEIEKANESQN